MALLLSLWMKFLSVATQKTAALFLLRKNDPFFFSFMDLKPPEFSRVRRDRICLLGVLSSLHFEVRI